PTGGHHSRTRTLPPLTSCIWNTAPTHMDFRKDTQAQKSFGILVPPLCLCLIRTRSDDHTHTTHTHRGDYQLEFPKPSVQGGVNRMEGKTQKASRPCEAQCILLHPLVK